MANLKRFDVHEMFGHVAKFGQRWPCVHREQQVSTEFFVIPRYNACVRANSRSIDFFFHYLHRVHSLRSKAFHQVLKAACKAPFIRKLLIKMGVVEEVVQTGPYTGVDWSQIDVLFAEWHFVGAFSGENGEVAHVLGFPEFRKRLERELNARSELRDVIPIPETKQSFLDAPAGWVEQIVGSKKGQLIEKKDYERAQKMLLNSYWRLSHKADPEVYLRRLITQIYDRYDEPEKTLPALEELIRHAQILTSHIGDRKITLGRTHGDFKPSQLLIDESEIYIIDWSESTHTWIVHDLIDILISKDVFSFNEYRMPGHIEVLFEGLQFELKEVPLQLPFVITLLEIAVRQHVVFSEGRGPIKRWKKAAENVLNHVLA